MKDDSIAGNIAYSGILLSDVATSSYVGFWQDKHTSFKFTTRKLLLAS